jgi:hypothetical protein
MFENMSEGQVLLSLPLAHGCLQETAQPGKCAIISSLPLSLSFSRLIGRTIRDNAVIILPLIMIWL